MESVTQIKSETSNAYRSLGPQGSELGKDEFLRLLVTQLQNQDPVNPMDSSEFASQLAQFNSVEQLINVNDSLTAMSQSQELIGTGLNNTLASSLPGKTIKASSNQLMLGADGSPVNFSLDSSASEVEITIRNENGVVVRTETLKNKGTGDHEWTWNGESTDGKSLPEGKYTVSVDAKDGDSSVNATTYIKGEVSKVKYTNQGVQLLVNGLYIGLGDVEEIGA